MVSFEVVFLVLSLVFPASVSSLCSLLMVSFEVVFQVLSLVFPASVSSFCSLLMVSFELVFLVLRFTKFVQFLLISQGKLSTGVSSSKG